MRDFILVYINGERHELRGEQAFMQLSSYLRYIKGLTGTKVVCSEGDCGACTILVGRYQTDFKYVSMNSCIQPMGLLDGSHVITAEGLGSSQKLHPIQSSMMTHHGAQCGYCTPGFICAMASMVEDIKDKKQNLTEQKVKNNLTGNLCRCTGYQPIIQAAMDLSSEASIKKLPSIHDLYDHKKIKEDFKIHFKKSVFIKTNWKNIDNENVERFFFLPQSILEAVKFKAENPETRLISGATDLGVLHNKNKIRIQFKMSLNNILESYQITETADSLIVGAKASLQDLETATEKLFPDFSNLLHIFASPQIKHQATLVGNLGNASPIGDTLPFLNVNEAEVILASYSNEKLQFRNVKINDFIIGYKKIDLKENEFIHSVKIKKSDSSYKLYKVSLRKDLDISQVMLGIRYKLSKANQFEDLELAYGGLSAQVERINTATDFLLNGKIEEAKKEVAVKFKPFSDVRSSAEYRILVAQNLIEKFMMEINT